MIGIFDSGIGGLTFLKEVRTLLPQYDYLYLGDSARVPYGSRSMETVQKYAEQGFQFLLKQGCTLTIIACNTMSAEALRYLQQKYPNQKILGVLIPAAEAAVRMTHNRTIGVVGTTGTINSGAFDREILKLSPEIHVHRAACPLLVPLIEEGMLDRSPITRKMVKNYIRSFKDKHIDTLILGCTHYPLIQKTFQRVAGKRVTVINSSLAAAQAVPAYLQRHPEVETKLSRKGSVRYCFTEVSDRTKQIGERFLGEPMQSIEKVTIEC